MSSSTLAILLIILMMILLILIRDFEAWQSLYLNFRMRHFLALVEQNAQTYTAEQLRFIFVKQLGVLEFFLEPHYTAGFSNRELSWLLNAQASLGTTASLVFGYAQAPGRRNQNPLLWIEFTYHKRLWVLYCDHGCPTFAISDPERFCEVNRLTNSYPSLSSPLSCPQCASSD